MPKTPPMYTGFGDGGQTGLLYGGRVSKADPRCEAYGALDEAVSAMGLGRALSPKQDVQEILLALQRESFTVGGEIAIDTDFYPKFLKHFQKVTADMVDKLEETTDALSEKIELPREFIMPGGSPAGAAIDLARSTVRRAERRTVELMDNGLLTNTEIPPLPQPPQLPPLRPRPLRRDSSTSATKRCRRIHRLLGWKPFFRWPHPNQVRRAYCNPVSDTHWYNVEHPQIK